MTKIEFFTEWLLEDCGALWKNTKQKKLWWGQSMSGRPRSAQTSQICLSWVINSRNSFTTVSTVSWISREILTIKLVKFQPFHQTLIRRIILAGYYVKAGIFKKDVLIRLEEVKSVFFILWENASTLICCRTQRLRSYMIFIYLTSRWSHSDATPYLTSILLLPLFLLRHTKRHTSWKKAIYCNTKQNNSTYCIRVKRTYCWRW